MSGALGEPELIRARHHTAPLKFIISPYRIPFSELQTVTDIACGYGFSTFVDACYSANAHVNLAELCAEMADASMERD